MDITYLETPFVYWPMVESSLGIIGACLPQMRPLFASAAFQPLLGNLEALYSSTRKQIGSASARATRSSSREKSNAAIEDALV